MVSWRAPGSMLEAPGLDFGVSRARCYRDFLIFLEGFFEVIPPRIPRVIYDAQNAKNAKNTKKADHFRKADP